MRPDWDSYFMKIAEFASERATCDRLHVGCVLVKDKAIIASGYNGSVSGLDHCDNVGHLMYENGCKRTIHAELNAILQCAKHGNSSYGATAYVTAYPCPNCMQALNQAGIKRIVFKEYYPHRYNNDFHYGMEVEKFEDSQED